MKKTKPQRAGGIGDIKVLHCNGSLVRYLGEDYVIETRMSQPLWKKAYLLAGSRNGVYECLFIPRDEELAVLNSPIPKKPCFKLLP